VSFCYNKTLKDEILRIVVTTILGVFNLVPIFALSLFVWDSIDKYIHDLDNDLLFKAGLPCFSLLLLVIIVDILALKRKNWRWGMMAIGVIGILILGGYFYYISNPIIE
jgi:hypothetical protein